MAHICTLEIVDNTEEMIAIISLMKSESQKSHRAVDLGLLEELHE